MPDRHDPAGLVEDDVIAALARAWRAIVARTTQAGHEREIRAARRITRRATEVLESARADVVWRVPRTMTDAVRIARRMLGVDALVIGDACPAVPAFL